MGIFVGIGIQTGDSKSKTQYAGGERCDRCRWQMKGAERVAAVDS